MVHKSISPSALLKPYIKQYHVVETNETYDFAPGIRIYPYGTITLVFHFGKPSLFEKKGEKPYVEPRTVICGQQTSHYDLSLAGNTGMILVVFKPHGAGVFFKTPLSELINDNIPLNEVVGNNIGKVEDCIQVVKNNNDRIAIVENFLLNKLFENYTEPSQIEHALRIIEDTGGQVKVKDLAVESCLSTKQFERKFTRFVGVAPKKYISIYKFQNVLRMYRKNPDTNLYNLAYSNGYYDQSHFIHDFKSITDLIPKDFFRDFP